MMKKILIILIINFFFISFALSNVIKINTITNDKKNFEKMEMLFDDYKIYTHRAGGIKIRRTTDNKQLVVFSDNFKFKFYNGGDQIFDFIFDEKEEKISISYRAVRLFTWQRKYIRKKRAYFFKIIAYNQQPFHYYINLQSKPSSALNIEKFELKIAKAESKAKKQIAAKYNVRPELIELILRKKKLIKDKQIEKSVSEKEEKLKKEIEVLVGKKKANQFDLKFIDKVENEFFLIINKVTEDLIFDGISQAIEEVNAMEILTRMQTKR